jgi:plastocyanin
MTIPLIMTIVVILILSFTLGLSLGLSNLIIPVVATHIGPLSVFSDVFTGGGNSSNPINEFDPINKEIYVTETIEWSNPTAGQPYPHTVTFIGNESSPLLKSKISNVTKSFQSNNLQSLISNLIKLNNSTRNENENKNLSPDATSLVFPSVINSSDPVVSYLNPDGHDFFKGAVYNFTGDTTYLNSGLIWAGGVIPDGFPKVNSFIVTFMKPGTYHYQCLIYIHPEMRGTITVKPLT